MKRKKTQIGHEHFIHFQLKRHEFYLYQTHTHTFFLIYKIIFCLFLFLSTHGPDIRFGLAYIKKHSEKGSHISNINHQRKMVASYWWSMAFDFSAIDKGMANTIGNAAITISKNVQWLQFITNQPKHIIWFTIIHMPLTRVTNTFKCSFKLSSSFPGTKCSTSTHDENDGFVKFH